MADEELTGIFGGISSGLTESIGQRLQSEGLDIRRDQNRIAEEGLQLDKDALAFKMGEADRKRNELEGTNRINKEKLKELELQNAEAERIEKSKMEGISIEEIATTLASGSPVPNTIQMTENLVRGMFPGRDPKSISKFEWNELSKQASAGEKPEFYEGINKILDLSIEQADNKRKVFERDLQKAIEKDPFLADNPEARQSNPKVFEMEQGIAGLQQASKLFFARKQQVGELQEQVKAQKEQREVNENIIKTQHALNSLKMSTSFPLGSEGLAAKTSSIIDDIAVLKASPDPRKKALGSEMEKIKRLPTSELRDNNLFKILVQDLPKGREVAIKAQQSIPRIQEALDLVNKGKVTGVSGVLRSRFAGILEDIGVSDETIENASDAEYYRILTRMFVGPMRLDLIGPGPVSDFEQKVLEKLSGGGVITKSTAKRLMNDYLQRARDKISLYNTTVNSAAKLNSSIKDAFELITLTEKDNFELTREAPQAQGGALTPEEEAASFFGE